MARIGSFVQITAIDHYHDLFRIESVCPDDLVQAILATDWFQLDWQRQEGQLSWCRRRVDTAGLDWIDRWNDHLRCVWPFIAQAVGVPFQSYSGTAWWLDEPGFTCPLHTDGEMPGAMHVTWCGARSDLGTSFYHYKDPSTVRVQFPMLVNTGYIMLNQAQARGYRHLQWHGMLQPVPDHSFRLTSYTWIIPFQDEIKHA